MVTVWWVLMCYFCQTQNLEIVWFCVNQCLSIPFVLLVVMVTFDINDAVVSVPIQKRTWTSCEWIWSRDVSWLACVYKRFPLVVCILWDDSKMITRQICPKLGRAWAGCPCAAWCNGHRIQRVLSITIYCITDYRHMPSPSSGCWVSCFCRW